MSTTGLGMWVGRRSGWLDLEVGVIQSSGTLESSRRIERQKTFDEVEEGVGVIRVWTDGVLRKFKID